MGLTQTELVDYHAICNSLVELSRPLSSEYTTERTQLWHATCAGVEVLRANGERHGVVGTASSGDDAVIALWETLLNLPADDIILVHGSRNDARRVRWDKASAEWIDVVQ